MVLDVSDLGEECYFLPKQKKIKLCTGGLKCDAGSVTGGYRGTCVNEEGIYVSNFSKIILELCIQSFSSYTIQSVDLPKSCALIFYYFASASF